MRACECECVEVWEYRRGGLLAGTRLYHIHACRPQTRSTRGMGSVRWRRARRRGGITQVKTPFLETFPIFPFFFWGRPSQFRRSKQASSRDLLSIMQQLHLSPSRLPLTRLTPPPIHTPRHHTGANAAGVARVLTPSLTTHQASASLRPTQWPPLQPAAPGPGQTPSPHHIRTKETKTGMESSSIPTSW